MRQHHDDQFHSLLNAELARSMQTLAELTTLVKSLHGDLHTGTYVNRIALLRKMPPVRKLQLQLRSTRERLHRLLDVKTTYVLSNPRAAQRLRILLGRGVLGLNSLWKL